MRATTARTSVRQAIVALYEPVPGREELSLALALDVVASLGEVDGFSLAVACTSAAAAREIGGPLPAGVDLRLSPAAGGEPVPLALARHYAQRRFERIILVTCETMSISPRLLSTASSTLATASPVLGETGSGRLFLVGASKSALDADDESTTAALAALNAAGPIHPLVGRRLDQVPLLSELAEADIARIVNDRRELLPRTWARLSELAT